MILAERGNLSLDGQVLDSAVGMHGSSLRLLLKQRRQMKRRVRNTADAKVFTRTNSAYGVAPVRTALIRQLNFLIYP